MSRSALDYKFEAVISGIAEGLKPQGFERHGKVLKAVADRSAAILEFQKSDKSSDKQIVFTINTGVVCGDLLDAERTNLKKATIEDAHLRIRLGFLLDPAQDIWWDITASTDCDSLAKELSQLLAKRAVPYLEQFMRASALIELWETGKSPGLTAMQRSRYLSELKHAEAAR